MDLADSKDFEMQRNITLFERVLKKQFQQEVEKKIKEIVMPEIEEKIKTIAVEAVEAWDTKMQISHSTNPFESSKIQIAFVENVINKIVHEDKDRIEVVKKNDKKRS